MTAFAQLEKTAKRGDQIAKLLARLGGSNLNSLLFKNKIVRPSSVARGVEGWQSGPAIGAGPGGMSHWFSGKPTEHAIGEIRGGDLIQKLKETLPSAVNERGGGYWSNDQLDAANLLRQIRRAAGSI